MTETANSPPAISVQTSSQNTQQHLGDIANAKTRSSIPQNSSTTGLRELTRSSVDPGVPDGYNDLTRWVNNAAYFVYTLINAEWGRNCREKKRTIADLKINPQDRLLYLLSGRVSTASDNSP